MSNDDICYWLGEPINAMTRTQLQDALYAAKATIEAKQNELVRLRHFYNRACEGSNETIDSNRFTDGSYLASFS